jgi:hypothetical protein
MILDKLAVFADAQSTTTSAASTDVVDTLAAGDAYEGAWFVVRVDTAFTATGAPTTVFQLQTATNEGFTTGAATLAQSDAYLVASLTAGKFWAVRIPRGAKRYLRGYKSITNYNAASIVLASCVYDMFITKDIDLEIQKRYGL